MSRKLADPKTSGIQRFGPEVLKPQANKYGNVVKVNMYIVRNSHIIDIEL